MIADDLRFEGFDAVAWARLLSLLSPPPPQGGSGARGALVMVVDANGAPLSALSTREGPVEVDGYTNTGDLPELCARLDLGRAFVLDAGALEEAADRTARRMPPEADYVAQCLDLLAALRELEGEGRILRWPERRVLPLPSPAMVRRTLDLLLPDGRCAVLGVWEEQRLWTALALRRQGGSLDWIVGPERILEWTGPLGGDFRRDHRALQRAIARAAAPVHLGIFAQRHTLEALLQSSEAGAWAKAVAVREVLISPTPRYVSAAVAADALRAAALSAGRWLGGTDLAGAVAPVLRVAREQIGDAGSVTRILGFNPLDALARRLSRRQ